MGSDLKSELVKALDVRVKTRCYIQEVFDRYKQDLRDLIVATPLPEDVHLIDDNFPYWIKLQWLNPKTQKWVDASPGIVIPLLEAGIFSDVDYRLEDPRRAKALPHLPDLLSAPDAVYRNPPISPIRGRHVYIQDYGHQIKAAYTLSDNRIQKVIVVSSFWTTWKWLRTRGRITDNPVYAK